MVPIILPVIVAVLLFYHAWLAWENERVISVVTAAVGALVVVTLLAMHTDYLPADYLPSAAPVSSAPAGKVR